MTAPTGYTFPCPGCQGVLPIPAEHVGRHVRCGKCGHVFQTAAPAPLAPAVPVEDDNPFALPASPAAELEEPEPPRPSGGRRREPEKKLPVGLIAGGVGLGLVLVIGAAAAIHYATKEPAKPVAEVTNKGKDTPRPKVSPKEKPVELSTTPDGRMLDTTRERVKESTVYVRTIYPGGTASSGSGFFAAGPGLVVTNAHVVGQSARGVREVSGVEVVVNSGEVDARTYPAKVLRADRGLDLALLEVAVPPPGPPPLEVIDSFKLKETQPVYIFGFPGGENLGANISVNISSISSLRRDEDTYPWIQVAGGMHAGNSGGPVTDAAGRVVGVARAKIVGTEINMAIPGDSVYAFFHACGDLIPKKPGK